MVIILNGIAAFVLYLTFNLVLGLDVWPSVTWTMVMLGLGDFFCWSGQKFWRWLVKPSPRLLDEWDGMQGVSKPAAPLIMGVDMAVSEDVLVELRRPGRIVMAKDLGLPSDATIGEIAYAANRALHTPPEPNARHSLRGADGKFVKRAA